MCLVGFSALFHGHAHGAEMPVDASGLEFGLAFVLATGILHLIGIGLGIGLVPNGIQNASRKSVELG